MKNIFNVRVYGVLVNSRKDVLVTDEFVYSRNITKFPGGGLQFGEGTLDCLQREFMEELNLQIKVVGHFYTTDFFQASFIDPSQQVISIYYLVEPVNEIELKTSDKPVDFSGTEEALQSSRWLPLLHASEEDVTFPIDRKVMNMLKHHFSAL